MNVAQHACSCVLVADLSFKTRTWFFHTEFNTKLESSIYLYIFALVRTSSRSTSYEFRACRAGTIDFRASGWSLEHGEWQGASLTVAHISTLGSPPKKKWLGFLSEYNINRFCSKLIIVRAMFSSQWYHFTCGLWCSWCVGAVTQSKRNPLSNRFRKILPSRGCPGE